jgi:hypothetical protein
MVVMCSFTVVVRVCFRMLYTFLRPPLIDMVVCVFSVGRRPATLETYQSASSRPTRAGFSLLYYRIYVEIFGGQNFAKLLNPKTHTPKFSRNFRPEPREFRENFKSPYKIVIKWIFSQSVGVRVDRRRKPTYQLTAALMSCRPTFSQSCNSWRSLSRFCRVCIISLL